MGGVSWSTTKATVLFLMEREKLRLIQLLFQARVYALWGGASALHRAPMQEGGEDRVMGYPTQGVDLDSVTASFVVSLLLWTCFGGSSPFPHKRTEGAGWPGRGAACNVIYVCG